DTFYIAREESGSGKSTILGFMMGFVSQSYPGHLFVWQIAVSEAAQGKGVGKKLLRHTVDFAKQSDSCSAVMATVETTNIGSQALFEKSGFSIDSARFKDVGLELITNDGKEAVVDYYGSGTDQIFYVLKV
ncbi:MAG: GNAT family N-acetyltransferase, partial [Bacteroidota bacterium]